jgi:hypothetical protein
VPIDLSREPHQLMARIDELLQGRRLKQVVLTIVARLVHDLSPTANPAGEGIMGAQKSGIPKARKPPPAPGFLAKANTYAKSARSINEFRILRG